MQRRKKFRFPLLLAVLAAQSSLAENPLVEDRRLSYRCPNIWVWTIKRPIVTRPTTPYEMIPFEPGDEVRIKEAGGCVQTGGLGDTWKLYVNPRGDNSDRLYHGVVRIANLLDTFPADTWIQGYRRLQSVVGSTVRIPKGLDPNDSYLWLGYEDDRYRDNGYWSPDDGTDDQCKNQGEAYVVIEITRTRTAPPCYRQPVLSTPYSNTVPDGVNFTDPNWPAAVCGNDEFLKGLSPPYEWTPVFPAPDQLDRVVTGLSGTALLPQLSGKDVPMTHPFGFDWEFWVNPDQPFTNLLAPSNNSGSSSLDGEYQAAINHATEDLGLEAVAGVAGVEIDKGLVPERYRVQDGDRVGVFGRWIVDCGHNDFHSEIHPPLLIAAARPESEDSTYSTVIGRPYFSSQDFASGPLFQHLLKEVGKAGIPIPFIGSARIEARPKILPKPFAGYQKLMYILRPPSSRRSARDVLVVDYRLIGRSGVQAMLTPASGEPDALLVRIDLNASAYPSAPAPVRSDWELDIEDIRQLSPELATALKVAIPAVAFNPLNPVLSDAYWSWVVSRGLVTDIYQAPEPYEDRVMTTYALNRLPAQIRIERLNSQPFPISGWIRLRWKRYQPPQ